MPNFKVYKSQSWVWNDPDVIPIEPGNQLYYLIEKISNLLAGDKTLFLIDDIIADETLDKCHQPLLKFSTLYWICLLLVFLILVGVELPLCL